MLPGRSQGALCCVLHPEVEDDSHRPAEDSFGGAKLLLAPSSTWASEKLERPTVPVAGDPHQNS